MSMGRGSYSQPPPPKTVLVYRNGDAFFPGRRFVINPRRPSTFDGFLNAVTRGITAPFGAVRNLYTPVEGHRIVALEQLVNGEIYVAAGAEKLKTLDYHHITTQKPQKQKSELSLTLIDTSLLENITPRFSESSAIRPVVHSRIIVPARWKRISNEPCAINVFTNGDTLVPPARVLIPKHTLASWENVLTMVTEKVHLRTGAVHGLCMLNGRPLRGACELQNNQFYVAVGAERFRNLPYYQLVPSKGVIHHLTDAISSVLPSLNRGKQDRKSFAKPEVDNSNSVFYARTEQVKQSRQASKIPGLYGTAEKSIFKATNIKKETVTASEVPEDESMKVDLPIEQMDVEEVEEDTQLKSGGDHPAQDFINYLNSESPPSTSQKISEDASKGGSQPNSHEDDRNETLAQAQPLRFGHKEGDGTPALFACDLTPENLSI